MIKLWKFLILLIKEFAGNTDEDTVVYHDQRPPIKVQYIRFRPVAWYRSMAIRVGLYDCQQGTENYCPEICNQQVSCNQLVQNFLSQVGVGREPIWRGLGYLEEILRRDHKRYQDPVLGRGLKYFSPKEVPILKQRIHWHWLSSAQYLNWVAKGP